ncbi:hypothetical protein BS17DRAFT_768932 [Gyrodon lividus]|nr:hypothetical protein BS17DRAFT_768932 [Gyrodon lividus]
MPFSFCWNPHKKHSTKQKTQVVHLQANYQTIRDKENDLAKNIHNLNASLCNALCCEKCAKENLDTAWKRAWGAKAESEHVSARAEASWQQIEALETQDFQLSKENYVMLKQLSQKALSSATPHSTTPLTLKNGGIILDAACDMVCELVAVHNVLVSRVNGTIAAVSSAARLEVHGEISKRSIGRIVLEGEVSASMQLVDEISNVQGITLSPALQDLWEYSVSSITPVKPNSRVGKGWKQACEQELAWKKIEQVIEDAGGFKAWVTLLAGKQQKQVETTCHVMHDEIGVEKIYLAFTS